MTGDQQDRQPIPWKWLGMGLLLGLFGCLAAILLFSAYLKQAAASPCRSTTGNYHHSHCATTTNRYGWSSFATNTNSDLYTDSHAGCGYRTA